jgi:hypothetical protein
MEQRAWSGEHGAKSMELRAEGKESFEKLAGLPIL